MTSLIQQCKEMGLKYSTVSSSIWSSDCIPDKALIDSDTPWFQTSSQSTPGQWWTITFPFPVRINKYILMAGSFFDTYPKQWTLYYSFNNITWNKIQTDSHSDTRGLRTPFYLKNPIALKHFKLVMDSNSVNNNIFAFSFFDCFGVMSGYVEQQTFDDAKMRLKNLCKVMFISQLIILASFWC